MDELKKLISDVNTMIKESGLKELIYSAQDLIGDEKIIKNNAKIMSGQFYALVGEGFNREEALTILCKMLEGIRIGSQK